ncbi:ABC transporter permease [Agrobacterium tumefaciens]|uniref:ABC transporter permease n=1 Tax=Agrobacterium tumefaciens TaxID=358 RepID=UPI002934A7CC|nr:ABC transporter permease [Agrobacterium tumefaciens]
MPACSYFFRIIFGSIFAAAKLSRFRSLRLLGDVYTTVVRGVPELLIIFLVFFGGGTLLRTIANGLFGYGGYIEPPIFIIGVLCISVSAGRHAAEVIRAARSHCPAGQIEAAIHWDGPWLRLPIKQLGYFPRHETSAVHAQRDVANLCCQLVKKSMRTAAMGARFDNGPLAFSLTAFVM